MLGSNHSTESKDSIIKLECKNKTNTAGPIDFPDPIVTSQLKNDRVLNIGLNDNIVPINNSNNSKKHSSDNTTVSTDINKNNKVYFNWFKFANSFLGIKPIFYDINTFEKNKLNNLLSVIKDEKGARHIKKN
ncbi:hypothetical protein CDIK_2824 [Cucumispora dikerogammari]|nr:hypothetical protein CDIK_2824 [Cucumispora dikerogammari]